VRITLVLLALLAIAVTGVIHQLPNDARADVIATTQDVHSLAIDGAGLPLAQLRDSLETRVGAPVDTDALERDRLAVEAALQARGFLGAKVASPTVTFGASGGAYVVFAVERGPLFHLRSVKLDGADWKHAGVVTLAPGDEAHGERLEAARREAEATLARSKAPRRVELVVVPDHAEALVDVTLVTR
jgi:outer membrane protein assembly factor BamA